VGYVREDNPEKLEKLVRESLADWKPYVFHLDRMVTELLSLTLLVLLPLSRLAIIAPSSLQILGGTIFHDTTPFSGTEVPDCLNILMVDETGGEVVSIASEDVHDTGGQI